MNDTKPSQPVTPPQDMPEVLRAFFEQASPPPGQGNASMIWNWKIAIFLLFYLPYAAIFLQYAVVPWILFGYSVCAVLLFFFYISRFKENMAYESNPFDFVQVQFLFLLNVVVLLGLAHWSLSLADPDQYNKQIDAFSEFVSRLALFLRQ
jgi:hypothetical protein